MPHFSPSTAESRALTLSLFASRAFHVPPNGRLITGAGISVAPLTPAIDDAMILDDTAARWPALTPRIFAYECHAPMVGAAGDFLLDWRHWQYADARDYRLSKWCA